MSNKSDPNFYEVGVAVGLEPTYPIVSIRTRTNTGKMDSRLNRQLMSFKGQEVLMTRVAFDEGRRVFKRNYCPCT